MAQPHRAMWLPPALLLLWVPGCFSLSGPRKVRGIVGGSLSVECRYREEFINNSKYWCKPPCVLLWKMAETTKSEREVTRDRMSIRDHPANLTFTVTLKSLREEDAGTYRCGINVPFNIDPIFEIEVSVIPAPPTPRPTRLTVPAETSTITTKVSTVSFTTLTTEGTTHNASSQEEYDPTQNWSGRLSTEQEREGGTPCPTQPTLSPFRLHELLIWLVLLLLLLGGISLLAWRMVQRRVKASKVQACPAWSRPWRSAHPHTLEGSSFSISSAFALGTWGACPALHRLTPDPLSAAVCFLSSGTSSWPPKGRSGALSGGASILPPSKPLSHLFVSPAS
ncbi:CMRF35-like molecule 8 isoform X3 [Bubalus bubalis]|uniref:CMRF35-like molecule 8 isoform X3 n=1 Tax=Bubalus bubalis TaxID=89462 RepID=UPI001D114FED|nr:CMRF35-like molecule 8 isoform X3 [Bubalus bubalis]